MRKVNLIALHIFCIATILFLFVGCGEEISSKNMEQLYLENGVPVKTKIIATSSFTKKIEFNAVISGAQESSAFTSLSDNVDKIYYNVGDYVKKDAVVISFPTDNPKAQFYQAKLAYENASSSFDRMKTYFETGGLSKQEYESAETSFKIAEANWNAIKQSVDIKAPISGIITRINVLETENVHEDDELFTIAQVKSIKSRVWVSDKDISFIQNGQRAIAIWNGHTVEGKVVQVDLSMNQMKKAFAVDLVFDNRDDKFRTGVTAKIAISIYENNNSIVVDLKDIMTEGRNQFVYLNNNGVAKRQTIETGIMHGTDVEITNGLNLGDELIVEGQLHLKDNTKINLITK